MANMNFGVNILPKTTNTYTLGNSDKKWNLYVNEINGTALSSLIPDVSGFYTKPSGGIPSTDLADTYLTSVPTLVGATSNAAGTAGLVPAPTTSDVSKFLRGDGTWATALTSHQDISGKANTADLATVATSGDYTDLLNKPDLSSYLTSVPTLVGATSSAAGTAGLVPAPTTSDTGKFLRGDGTWQDGGRPMVILSYGSSTWNDFINAYNNNVIVYCRASSNSNPASGSQTRMAFMAYVSDATNPTNVEFQYYRSMSSHSATAMGDEVYVYKLTNASGGTWSVTTRKASIKEIAVASGSKLGVSWSSDKVTLSNTMTAADMAMSTTNATIAGTQITTNATDIANLQQDMAPIITGKQCPVAVSIGQYVLLRGSTITGCSDGAYTAAAAIPANTDLDSTYLTALTTGVSNGLKDEIDALNSNLTTITNKINGTAINVNSYTTLKSVYDALENKPLDYAYCNIGNLDTSAIKSVIPNPATFANYTSCCIRFHVSRVLTVTARNQYTNQIATCYIYGTDTNTFAITEWEIKTNA